MRITKHIRLEYKVVFTYIIIGVLWILLSDSAMNKLFENQATIATAQLYKGWFFIVITGFFLFVLIRRNVSRIIKKEKRFEKVEKMNNDFLQSISHEIRTPLNNIVGFSEILTNSVLASNDRDKYIKIIQNSSYHLLSVANDISNISQIKSQQSEIVKEIINVKNLFKDIISNYKTQGAASEIEIFCNCELSDDELWVMVDQSKLGQIFISLMNFSFKVTDKGTITVSCKRSGEMLEFSVINTGKCIPKELLPYIFDSDYQTSSVIRDGGFVTGLGISLSKTLIDAMNGNLVVESEKDCGNTFIFSIPFVSAAKSKTVKAKSETNLQSRSTILVAEDNDLNFMYLKELLKKYDLNVLRAENGKEAVDACKENKDIRLVLMDIRMPVLNGYQATEIIKHIRPQLPVIIQTAYALEEDYKIGKKYGCDAYLTKPLNSEKLYYVIDKLIN